MPRYARQRLHCLFAESCTVYLRVEREEGKLDDTKDLNGAVCMKKLISGSL